MTASPSDHAGQKPWLAELAELRRSALIGDNPLFDFDKLVFVKRKTFQSNHYYTDFINGSRYFGGALCLLELKTGKVAELAPSLKDGIFGLYDVSFDGRRIVFDWKKGPDEGFRIYEVGADGAGLRQIDAVHVAVPGAGRVRIGDLSRARLAAEYRQVRFDGAPRYAAHDVYAEAQSQAVYVVRQRPEAGTAQ